MASKSDEGSTKAVGPYLLQRTLGKGQTGMLLVVITVYVYFECECQCVYV